MIEVSGQPDESWDFDAKSGHGTGFGGGTVCTFGELWRRWCLVQPFDPGPVELPQEMGSVKDGSTRPTRS